MCDELDGEAEARLEVVCASGPDDADAPRFQSSAIRLLPGSGGVIRWKIDCDHKPISALRLVVSSPVECHGVVRLVQITRGDEAEIVASSATFGTLAPHEIPGWICTMDAIGKWGRFASDNGFRILVTGNRAWSDTSISCTLNIHCAERAGLLLNYQGLKRFYAVVISHGRLKVIRNLYGETVLFDAPAAISEDTDFQLEANVADGVITVRLDDAEAAVVRDDTLRGGGAGLCVEDGCFSLVGDMRISAHRQGTKASRRPLIDKMDNNAQ